ncbi:hypothetical protein HMN09_01315400 [Mycena chlorophos]|uniref:F-box domain-containing protein n=1 Tax=Mycena chlorophos TaxID=658473 RepID=A0A8H6VQ96_MYCCL|nr:hypothetical protein HMN09_01315400 [Mycena chlorophos]
MDTLPQEVIARIVDELDDREASLRACALVSSQFTEPCQRRLFSKLHMQPQEVALYLCYISYTAAINHFHNFPHLAGYVKHLELNLLNFSKETPMQALARILDHLRNICDVTLKQGGFYFLSHAGGVEAYTQFHRVLDMIWSCEPQIWNTLCFRTLPNVPWELIREGLWRTSTLRVYVWNFWSWRHIKTSRRQRAPVAYLDLGFGFWTSTKPGAFISLFVASLDDASSS